MKIISRFFICMLVVGSVLSNKLLWAEAKSADSVSVNDLPLIELLGERRANVIAKVTKPITLSYGKEGLSNNFLHATHFVKMRAHNWYTPYFLPYPSENLPMNSGCMIEQSYEAWHRVERIEAGSVGVSKRIEFRSWQRRGEGFDFYQPELKDQYQEVRIFFNNTILYCGLLSDSPKKGSALTFGQLKRFLNNAIGLNLNLIQKTNKQPGEQEF